MMAPAAFGRVRYCRFVHTETARAKPMHSKGLWRTDSEEFSAHPEPSRTPAAHARGRPASSSLLCELLDRILAVVHVAVTCPPAKLSVKTGSSDAFARRRCFPGPRQH